MRWCHSIAWELNWHPYAVQNRTIQRNKTPPIRQVYNSINAIVQNYCEEGLNLEGNSIYYFRQKGLNCRFPILENEMVDSAIGLTCLKKIGVWQDTIFKEILNNDTLKETIISYTEKYTLYNDKHLDYPTYQPVFLLSKSDLLQLHKELRKLDKAKGFEQRKLVNDILKDLLKSFLGYWDEDFNNMEIGKLLFDLCCFETKSEYWHLTLIDLEDPTEISENIIYNLKKDLINCLHVLEDIILLGDSFPSKFNVFYRNGTQNKYYWIPLDIFPHNPKIDDVSNSYF